MDEIRQHYNFHTKQWDSFEELRDAFEWYVPEEFNAARFLCDHWAERREDRTAVFYEDRTSDDEGAMSFQTLQQRSSQLANRLADLGVMKGDRIGVNLPRKRETLITYIAAWRMGAVPVPLSTLFGPDALRYRLADSEATVCVVDTSNLEAYREIQSSVETIEFTLLVGESASNEAEESFWSALEGASQEFEPVQTAPEDDLILMYTSGTTGPPKGVRHAHRAVIGHIPGAITNGYNMEIRGRDVAWSPVEYSWAGTMSFIITAWLFGNPIVTFESGEAFEPHEAFSLIERYGVTLATVPPSGLRMMMQVDSPNEKYDVESVRHIVSGGEALGTEIPEWAAELFDATVHEAYGQTEIWNLIAGDCIAQFEARPGWFGKPLPGHEMAILDRETREVLGTDEVGEIAVHRDDPAVLKEFWNKPKKTEAKFHDEWVLTGDVGIRDEAGYFKFVSRTDDVIISSGYRIGPAEVEDTLARHEAIADAGVIGVPDDTRGQVPKAFVVLVDGYEATDALVEDIQSFVREQLADYEYPRHIEMIETLPRTTTGKVRRADLREKEGL